jgi:hypothetical protein
MKEVFWKGAGEEQGGEARRWWEDGDEGEGDVALMGEAGRWGWAMKWGDHWRTDPDLEG